MSRRTVTQPNNSLHRLTQETVETRNLRKLKQELHEVRRRKSADDATSVEELAANLAKVNLKEESSADESKPSTTKTVTFKDERSSSNPDEEEESEVASSSDSDITEERQITEDSIDMAGALTPAPYHGRSDEDPSTFWRNMEAWLALSKITEGSSKVAAVGLLLQGVAKMWFDGLSNTTSFDELRRAFHERFGATETTRWRLMAEMWDMRQIPNQSSDEFITIVEAKGRKCGMGPEQIRLCAFNGLLPRIKADVISHEIADMAALRQWASVSEAKHNIQASEDSLASVVKRLEDKFDSLHVRAVEEQPRAREPQRSVRFNDATDFRRPGSGDRRGRGRDFAEDRCRGNRYPTPFNNSQSASQNWSPTYYAPPASTTFHTARGSSNSCGKCGRSPAHAPRICPAMGKACNLCGKPNHFARVCRSVRRNQTHH